MNGFRLYLIDKMTFKDWLNSWAQYGRLRMLQVYEPYGLDHHPSYRWNLKY
uniref:Uncharacterized protein n=1 Tax=viral metagenome TaxID=1070528 RepID=A0A6C0AH92_9ZZZZ